MKRIRNLLIIMSGILTVFYIINHNGNLTLSKYLVIISLYPVYFVPSILKILFKFDLDEKLEFSYICCSIFRKCNRFLWKILLLR